MSAGDIAILIPCLNEAATIGDVVTGFKETLPGASIYVYDNNSTDDTAEIASANGAIVRREVIPGKGAVVQRMFREVEADVYVLVDGDGTYSPEDVHRLLHMVAPSKGNAGVDMAVGTRLEDAPTEAFRQFHGLGNRVITGIINRLFGCRLTDVLSGYRVFSRGFVKSIPLISNGFEVETELTLNALDGNYVICEVPVSYRPRPPESHSKLNTWSDGFRILLAIVKIFKDYRPLLFFSVCSGIFSLLGIAVGTPVITEYVRTGYINRIPSAVLAASLEVLSFVSLGVGFVLDTLARFRRQNQSVWRRMLS